MSLESVFRLSLIMNMIDNITGPMAHVNSTVDGSVTKLQNVQTTLGNAAKTGSVIAGIGAQITTAALGPVKATFDTKNALGELKSVGIKDLAALEKASTQFSDTWAGTTKADFISSAYDIKSGIASLSDEAVAKYTELAGITAKGTKASISDMTSLFATGYNIYKVFYKNMSDIDFGKLFAAGIAHAANIFKTDGPQMAEAISSLGAAATSAKVPMEEQFSILGMLQATMSGSEAGTKYRAFLQSAAQAGETLGLKFTDANNQLLSMPEILAKLKGKFGETMDAAEKMQLQKAFGQDDAVAMVDLMYSKTGELQNGILSMYDSMGGGIKEVKDMADAINNTDPGRYEVLKQKIHNTTEEIGNDLLPTFNKYLAKGDQMLTKIDLWINKHQNLVKVISLLVIALGTFLTVGGTTVALISSFGLVCTKTAGYITTLKKAAKTIPDVLDTIHIKALYAGDGLKNAFSTVGSFTGKAVTAVKDFATGIASMARQAISAAFKALPGLISSVWGFTAALFANPITWIVIGIIALIAAIILLWKHWDSVTTFIKKVWNGFVNGIKAGFDWIKNLFNSMPEWLKIALAVFAPFIGIPLLVITHWDSIVAYFKNLFVRIKTGFVNGINNIKQFFIGLPAWFRQSGAKIIDTLVEGIKSAALKPVNAVKDIFKNVRKLLPFSDAKEGPLSSLTLSGHRTMSTIAAGITKGQDLPYQAVKKSLGKIDTGINTDEGGSDSTPALRREVKKISLREILQREDTKETTTTKENGGTIIEKLLFNVDISKIKDLMQLFKLLQEIEDNINSNSLVTEGEG